MVPKTRSKTRSPNAPTAPEQKEKVVKVPTTTKRTIQKKTTKSSTAPKNSKKKLTPKSETDVDIKTESDQASGSQTTSTAEAQPEVKTEVKTEVKAEAEPEAEPEVKTEPIKRPAKKRGPKPKAKSTAESEEPSNSEATPASDSQPSTQPESSVAPAKTAQKRGRKPKSASVAESSQQSDSQTIAQGMSVINSDSDSEEKPKAKRVARSKTTKEPKPKKELKLKREPTKRVVKPNVNKKEKRRKIKASEIPGFSQLSKDMASRVVRVLLQRIFVLSRSQDDESRETFEIIGSTGTSYTVKISDKLSCSCVDYRFKRLHCKHILTVLLKVYHLHFSNPLFKSLNTTYNDRKAAISDSAMTDPSVLVSNEVREKIVDVMTNKPSTGTMQKAEQRPLDTSDCPVCFEAFEPENINFIAFCYTCGNNIHKECLEQWIRSKGGLDRATCVYCRSPWVEIDETPTIKKWHQVDASHRDGKFVNFSQEFGIKRTRDQSTYGDNYLKFIE